MEQLILMVFLQTGWRQTALDKLNSRVDIIDETEEEINTSSTKIENEF